MAKAVFAVVLNEPNADASRRLQEAYADMLTLNNTVTLVRADTLSEEIAVTAGIKGERQCADGVVFKLTCFWAGYTAPAVWDWLDQDGESA